MTENNDKFKEADELRRLRRKERKALRKLRQKEYEGDVRRAFNKLSKPLYGTSQSHFNYYLQIAFGILILVFFIIVMILKVIG